MKEWKKWWKNGRSKERKGERERERERKGEREEMRAFSQATLFFLSQKANWYDLQKLQYVYITITWNYYFLSCQVGHWWLCESFPSFLNTACITYQLCTLKCVENKPIKSIFCNSMYFSFSKFTWNITWFLSHTHNLPINNSLNLVIWQWYHKSCFVEEHSKKPKLYPAKNF